METGIRRCPVLETAQIRHLSVVPESFTPDTAYILGEAPGLQNFFVAAGMNSVGIASAGGAGRALAEWIVQGYPTEDLWDVDIRRCQTGLALAWSLAGSGPIGLRQSESSRNTSTPGDNRTGLSIQLRNTWPSARQ